jgi:hypothetical protein
VQGDSTEASSDVSRVEDNVDCNAVVGDSKDIGMQDKA